MKGFIVGLTLKISRELTLCGKMVYGINKSAYLLMCGFSKMVLFIPSVIMINNKKNLKKNHSYFTFITPLISMDKLIYTTSFN